MIILNILIYEHVSGGGSVNEPMSSSSLSEGFAMLRGAVSDFKAAGHNVIVLLDPRFAVIDPPLDADRIIFVKGDVRNTLIEASKDAEAALIIAPETEMTLSSMVEFVESIGLLSLNCDADAITEATDKASLYKHMNRIGIRVPDTFLYSVKDFAYIVQAGRNIGFPLVIKPVNGAGCRGISIVKDEQEIMAAVDKIQAESPDTQILVQKFIEGTSASVSLVSTGKVAVAISLNKQQITLASPNGTSSYNGGETPLEHSLKAKAFEISERVIESFPGLKGYVGVDLILSKEEVFVIEVNARLTSSYTGLRKIIKINVAEAIMDAILKGKLPEKIDYNGYSRFSKISIEGITPNAYTRTYNMIGIASPPFPTGEAVVYSMVVSKGPTPELALKRFNQAERKIQQICHEKID